MGLICRFLTTDDVEYFFHVLIGHLFIFTGEMSAQIFCSFFSWVVFLIVEFCFVF